MNDDDPLAAWRSNPFFVLDVRTDTPQPEVERAGQRLIALLTVGSMAARHYSTPLGPATRDADQVRQALAALRDPRLRVLHELWANVAQAVQPPGNAGPWEAAERAIGWSGM